MKYFYNADKDINLGTRGKIRVGSYILLEPSALRRVGWSWLHHNEFIIKQINNNKILVKMHNKKYGEDAQFWFNISDVSAVETY